MNFRSYTKIEFWKKVNKTEGCWEWTGGRYKRGYGRASIARPIGEPANTLSVYAHRLSWEITYGPIPQGMSVCHKCDNPPCVRPDHLFLGTQADNNRDMHAKGRGRPGGRKIETALSSAEGQGNEGSKRQDSTDQLSAHSGDVS